MAVAFDAKMTAGNSSDGLNHQADDATSISSTGITVGGGANILVMVMCGGGSGAQTAPTGVTATWNGVSMTLATSILSLEPAPFGWAAIFTLDSPAPGANTLAASWTNINDIYMSAVSFSGAGGIRVADTTTATQTDTVTVPSTTDGATVAVFGVDGNTPTMNFTKIFAISNLSPGGGANYQLGGTSNAHVFTSTTGTRRALVGVHILAGAMPPIDYSQFPKQLIAERDLGIS